MDPEKARINEINFLEFCTRIYSIRKKLIDIKIVLADLTKLLDFDVEKVSEIVDEIFAPHFQLRPNEVNTLIEHKYVTAKELIDMFNKCSRTIYRYKAKGKDATLYPRLDEEHQIALNKFMEQHDKFLVRNYQNMIIGGKENE